ncbi:MAG: hypothetical protein ACOC58_00080 [Chloroflexota bacterium]
MAVMDETTLTLATVTGITGRINAIGVWDPNEPTAYGYGAYVAVYTYDGGTGTTPVLVLGSKLSVRVDWENTCLATVKGHVDVDITEPDGNSVRLTATQGNDETIGPGGTQTVVFEDALTLDQVGNYSGKVTLTGVAV